VHSFGDLAMYQRAQDLAVQVVALVEALPERRAAQMIGAQLLRSATSIAANIAEGHGRFAAGAYRNQLSIARGSVNETIGWIDLLQRSSYLLKSRADELISMCDELLRMISAQMIKLDRETGKRGAFREERASYGVE
jgi:four helix bundle protein